MGNKRAPAATIVALTVAICGGSSPALAQAPDVVFDWNQIAFDVAPPGPPTAQRHLSMMHIAMFDAINAVERAYTPYRASVHASRGASPEAAAAQAAHDVLTALFPAQHAAFDALLTSELAGLPPGRARQGTRIGRAAAQAILAWRQNDGWPWPPVIVPDPTYVLPPTPGFWQPTPPANSFATFTFYPRVLPFAIQSATQFLPPPPPVLTSLRYATDYNETKLLGSETSAVRTADQTLVAEVNAGVVARTSFIQLWNNVARDIARVQNLSLVDTARLFVFVNVGIHDALETSFTSKFVYGLWRPVTAIRRGDEDGNPLTEPDTSWTPLLVTPPYPTYAGNAACLSAAAARTLQLVFGTNEIPFAATWLGIPPNPDVTRVYTGFWQLADEQARSRIYGGIHFQFDSEASQTACVNVADYVYTNYMIPR